MQKITTNILSLAVGVVALLIALPTTAFAHVVVKPSEATSASYQTFNVSVPNEREVDVTQVKLLVPDGVTSVTPTQKTGWEVSVEKSGTGETALVKSITWQGGVIPAELRDDFSFSAKTPAKSGELTWKAYQTYADGVTVAWDKSGASSGHGGDTGPASVTKIIADDIKSPEQIAAEDAQTSANRAIYLAIISSVIALIAIWSASRTSKKR